MSVIYGSEQLIDTGRYVGTIFLGLAKAFDCACVNHDMHIIIILLQKLNHYGIWEDEYEWMKSFLYGRTQQVCEQNTFLSSGLITIGVPQGYVLEPLLFSTYALMTCQLQLMLMLVTCMFADNTELRYCHNHLQRAFRMSP